ncbi:hypothetical protein BKA62DRAFT_833446 [Auriculariales sp. MPI-PUGE-AT-0066]|nr:hypothetical protein BKA62DRAFT_833446 [Auriculariales sp. MPI-PUGE-AT-0066]
MTERDRLGRLKSILRALWIRVHRTPSTLAADGHLEELASRDTLIAQLRAEIAELDGTSKELALSKARVAQLQRAVVELTTGADKLDALIAEQQQEIERLQIDCQAMIPERFRSINGRYTTKLRENELAIFLKSVDYSVPLYPTFKLAESSAKPGMNGSRFRVTVVPEPMIWPYPFKMEIVGDENGFSIDPKHSRSSFGNVEFNGDVCLTLKTEYRSNNLFGWEPTPSEFLTENPRVQAVVFKDYTIRVYSSNPMRPYRYALFDLVLGVSESDGAEAIEELEFDALRGGFGAAGSIIRSRS